MPGFVFWVKLLYDNKCIDVILTAKVIVKFWRDNRAHGWIYRTVTMYYSIEDYSVIFEAIELEFLYVGGEIVYIL